ncbi:HAMP domain-containing sensor histidine kinase [Streptomyces sp. NBC_00083]|uniref:sensor histidine kinase n=1 Tax=Streptomyces sp. NBC_00083 TaxID=2975647 RepID=UPI00224EE7FD|nr:HAMP domain-containing sensor histidine kinase [Streptomyces sp. NBC_00083]MCX5387520.1 HAMP domain-containing histidine kinase [Streptomyces sp. NBC_00083]
MRQRVVRVAVTAVLIALVLLAVPLGLAIRSSFFADERDALERAALAGAVRVSPDFATGDPVELPAAAAGQQLGLYGPGPRLKGGSGPPSGDQAVRQALATAEVRSRTGTNLVVAVPVSHNERVIGVVRASTATQDIWRRILAGWGALLAVALIALAVAILVARRQARALTAPLEDLSRQCRAVTDGDLTARARPSPIAEIDQVAHTHNDMLHSLTELLQHEKNFTANASHQLRTPLTGLQLTLESALAQDGDSRLRPAIEEALASTRHLHRTVEDVLRLTRTPRHHTAATARESVGRVLDDVTSRWHGLFAGDGRRLAISAPDATTDALIAGRAVTQILDILLENARLHGRGAVEVTVRDFDDTLAFDVGDEGTLEEAPAQLFTRGHTTGPGEGIGLSLAQDLAGTLDGRLSLVSYAPTRFTLLVPLGHPGGVTGENSPPFD